ncbi:MAG TPA: hypothetical protein H9680_07440 [Firmicutes bacterium]|nr:hypothetical protein [Bacillota bacterium]
MLPHRDPRPRAALAILLGSLAGLCLWTAAQLDQPDFTPAGLLETLPHQRSPSPAGTVYLAFWGDEASPWEEILDLLEEEEAPASFFLAPAGQGDGPLLRRMRDEGHALGLLCPGESLQEGEPLFWETFDRWEALLQGETGRRPSLCLLPQGVEAPWLQDGLSTRGYRWVDQSAAVWDPPSALPEEEQQLVLVLPGAASREELKRTLLLFREAGWAFATLEENGAPVISEPPSV